MSKGKRTKKRRGGNVEAQQEVKYHFAGKAKIRATPSRKDLREYFDYDTVSGALVRKATGKSPRTWHTNGGNCATCCRWVIDYKRARFKHARLVYAWHFDDPGPLQVDHIDGDTRNDRIQNLRIATQSQNLANRTNAKGYYKTEKELWRVDVMKDGKHNHGGTYFTEAEAAKVAKALKKSLFGQFSSYESRRGASAVKRTESLPLFDGVPS
jgi:hypothetical protein